jgi:ABC-type phosphate transport system permease subunit
VRWFVLYVLVVVPLYLGFAVMFDRYPEKLARLTQFPFKDMSATNAAIFGTLLLGIMLVWWSL